MARTLPKKGPGPKTFSGAPTFSNLPALSRGAKIGVLLRTSFENEKRQRRRETSSEGQGTPGPLNSGMAKEGVRAPQMTQTELQKTAETLEICEKRRRWQQQL